MKKYSMLAGILLLAPSLTMAGTMSSMSKDDVMSTFSDKTITTISAATLNGKVINDSFTGYFSKDGNATGSFETKPDDGPQSDTGTWKVNSDGKFCFKWSQWDQGKEKCVSIYKLGNGYLVVNDQNNFESMILSEQIKSGNQMAK